MVFLQPEYFKLFFLLVLLAPLWLFYFFSKRNARKRLGAAGQCARSLPPLFVARRDALSADQSGIGSPGARAGPPSTRTGNTGRPT